MERLDAASDMKVYLCGVVNWLFENSDYEPKPKVIPEIPCFSRCNILIKNDKEMNIEPMHGNGLFLQCQLQGFYDIISLSTYQYYVLSAIRKLAFIL